MKHLVVILVTILLFSLVVLGMYMVSFPLSAGGEIGWAFYFIALFGIIAGWGATLYHKYL